MNKLLYSLAIVIFCSCTNTQKTEIHQNERDNIINVRGLIKEIEMKDVLVSSIPAPRIVGDYLLIVDYPSKNKFIHVFDKNTFEHINSVISNGRGPREIIRLGEVSVGETDRVFYATDYGKRKLFRYDIDSVLANPQYMPTVKMDLIKNQTLIDSEYINDTLSIGLVLVRGEDKATKTSVAKLNMNTGEMKFMKYKHPTIKEDGKTFAVSLNDDIYVECYTDHDLVTICNLNGDLKCNIYGPNWNTQTEKWVRHFWEVQFYNGKIFVPYLGESIMIVDENGQRRPNYPTQFLVFEANGDYIKTLEIGCQILSYCFDEENNRMIMSFNDAMQFAYLDLDEVID